MAADGAAPRLHVASQVAHWRVAAMKLEDLESFAPAAAWAGLERYLGIALRHQLREAVTRLIGDARLLQAQLDGARSDEDLERVRRRVIAFRRQYLRTETMLDFYGDALSTRTSPQLAGLLAGCDALIVRSIQRALDPLGKRCPPVLTYVDKGLGASILRAGLRLWDGGSPSAVAAVKIARHNLSRPTALIHEAGHQVGHMTDFNAELAALLAEQLEARPSEISAAWSSWASEIAADAFAFVIAGYGSVAALRDVVAGEHDAVFRHLIGDPHPIAYLRVLLGVEMCRAHFGRGPWDGLAEFWVRAHPAHGAPAAVRALVEGSLQVLPRVAELALTQPVRAFGGRALAALIDPAAVRPQTLETLEREAGAALYTSSHWLREECLRLLALGSLRTATEPHRSVELAALQQEWMVRLGTGASVRAEAA